MANQDPNDSRGAAPAGGMSDRAAPANAAAAGSPAPAGAADGTDRTGPLSPTERIVAHYNLLDLRGEGALGPVYRARDTRVGRTVALRLVPAARLTDAVVRERFFRDVHAAAMLSHPNIATLFDVGEHDGGAYLAYEYAQGVTVREEMGGRPLGARRALEIATQVADALATGHGVGLVHGDVRPDNIVITPKGNAKLLEFGMSAWTGAGRYRAQAASSPEQLGPDAMPVVSYMSPEQALGGSTDIRTDVFSLGAIVYEMLTGKHPFANSNVVATVINIMGATPPAPSSVLSAVPPEVDPILSRALAKDISKRHPNGASLSTDLRTVSGLLSARSGVPEPTELIPLDEPRGGSGKWIAIALTLLVLVGLFWYLS